MTISGTQTMIIEKYTGDREIAVTLVGGQYDIKGPYGPRELEGNLDHSQRTFEDYGFKILQTYKGVNDPACRKVKRAVRELGAGKKVDLERLLAR